MLKRSIVAFMLSLSSIVVNGQDSKWYAYQGDKALEQERYAEAIEFYTSALEYGNDNQDVIYNLAESYRLSFQYDEAEVYYQNLVLDNETEYPLATFFLGLMLKYNGEFEKSTEYLQDFVDKHKGDKQYKIYIKGARSAIEGNSLAADDRFSTDTYEVFNFPYPINSPNNDYALSELDSNTVFITSGRDNKGFQDMRFGESYTDIYEFDKKNDVDWEEGKKIEGLNTKYNDGGGKFNLAKNKYYFTVCDPSCRIKVTASVNGKWTAPVALNANINPEGTDSRHPGISYTGDTLFFVSNRQGGYGRNDIWMSIDSGNDHWGPAINLGPKINTTGDEASPRATELQNILLFSSNGHAGFGGMDIFMAKKISVGDTLLYNLGTPFNCSRDDMLPEFGINKIYWSSNRKEGQGKFDIFYSPIRSEIAFLSGISLRSATQPPTPAITSRLSRNSNTQVDLVIGEGSVLYENLTYQDKQLANEIYKKKISGESIRGLSKNMSDEKYQLLLSIVNEKLGTQLQKQYNKKYDISNIKHGTTFTYTVAIVDSLTNKPVKGAKVIIKNKDGKEVKTTFSNDEGKIRFTNIDNDQGLYMSIVELPSVVSSILLKDQQFEYPEEEVIPTSLETLYFNFGSYNLRPEVKLILDDIAKYLHQNDGAQLEIYGHTDNRGSSEFNLILAEKRANTVMQYLLGAGIDATNLSIVPVGKSQPASSNKTSLGQQKNRRVEFSITGNYSSYSKQAAIFFAAQPTSLKEIASALDVPLAELVSLNGIGAGQTIKANRPVRIPINIQVGRDLLLE